MSTTDEEIDPILKWRQPRTEEVEEEEANDFFVSETEREKRRQGRRPNISHLKDATIRDEEGNTYPLFVIGQTVLVERCTDLLKGNPWLITHELSIRDIDDETGLCKCIDIETSNHVCISFKDPLTKIKFLKSY